MRLFIHNSFHAGDVALTRLLIATLQETFPELELTLECRPCYRYLWEDFGLPIVPYEGSDHTTTDPTPNCPPDAFFINAWFGLYDDILTAFSLTYPNNVYSFNRQMKTYDPEGKYKLSVPDVTPALQFPAQAKLPVPITENSILIENGKPRSRQSKFPINDYLEYLAKSFPKFIFYCTSKPPCHAPNLIDCSSLNLIQLSELSNHCRALITLCSGVNAVTYTEANRFKPRCFMGLTLPLRVWDDIANPVYQAHNIKDITDFLNNLETAKPDKTRSHRISGFDPAKMCKFLKSRSEIEDCSRYLYDHDYISHALPCKNWEIAHILADLQDGNLLDMGSTDSYILKNAVLKRTKGLKYGIDLRKPDHHDPEITYLVGDLLAVPLPDGYFQYITCLSVIEHEVDIQSFAAEASRLLANGGKLYVTFDYWTPKIMTDLKLYGLAWKPLDDWDVQLLQYACEAHNLQLIDDIDWSLGEAVIRPGYYSPHPQIAYTFGMLVFEKML